MPLPMPESVDARLAATDLACRRGERLLFREFSLALGPGEALHVTGPNGVGKSSLIRILAGLLRPSAGTVERAGVIGLLDERHALDPQVELGTALAFWRSLDGVDQALDRVDLEALREVPVRYLSTGQTKRAALARLLGQKAPIWLLDEPLNGLDSTGVALVEGLIAEHLAGGGLAVIASHQPLASGAEVLDLSDFVSEELGSTAATPHVSLASHTPAQPPPPGGGA